MKRTTYNHHMTRCELLKICVVVMQPLFAVMVLLSQPFFCYDSGWNQHDSHLFCWKRQKIQSFKSHNYLNRPIDLWQEWKTSTCHCTPCLRIALRYTGQALTQIRRNPDRFMIYSAPDTHRPRRASLYIQVSAYVCHCAPSFLAPFSDCLTPCISFSSVFHLASR